MGNNLRCCLACVLPCGALDLIRIVHLNGHVEAIGRPITAGEILQANPDHVLSKPCSESVDVRRVLILSPDDELKRGSIYFLIPDPSLQGKKKSHAGDDHRQRRLDNRSSINSDEQSYYDRCFSDVVVALPEKKSKSRGQISSCTPRMECICEE